MEVIDSRVSELNGLHYFHNYYHPILPAYSPPPTHPTHLVFWSQEIPQVTFHGVSL